MSSSSSALPTSSNPQPQPQPHSAAAAASSTVASLRAFLSRLSSSTRRALSDRRPWPELLDRSAFSRPQSLSDATSRIRRNASYFRVNYLVLLALVLALSLVSHPFSLLTLLSLLAAWLFLYAFRPSDHPLVLLGRTFSDRETLALLSLLTVVVVFLTSVGSLLISASMVGLAIVAGHGAFRDPEDLFMDEQESAGSGLFSYISGAASAASAAPSLASRV
ncbi:PRA1 family protein B3-like [Rhodamnia argentea]|uniref:PRA1 family protein n=1 Tax=Rhodamnia argentea TaxID=178133 RepID=A0A8B8NQQ7_9MYRT|nr:PRA1 family protein B3-like [Rhodamnia argentea]XP_048139893.1 PRA1 family protein B3-like [Rhodamnia argentea]XP_048139894.1 PRA1 family protein B3-like [Rhodamnia argentea]XP_048139895.1 PRA1 family protein B3-like [Rhodamnia argentea]